MGKRLVQGVLLLAIFLILPASVAGIWVRQEMADTDRYVASVKDLPSNPEVQEAIVQLVGSEVSARVTMDWETFVTTTVSSRTIQSQLLGLDVDVQGFVEDQTRRIIQEPGFTPVWVAINEAAHPLVKDVLLGNDSDAVAGADGDIELNISPIYNALVQSLAGQGIDLTRVLPAEVDDLSLTIYDSPSLQQTQRIARLIDRWALPLVGIAVVLGLLVVVISHRKPLAVAVVGLTVLLSMAASLLALAAMLDTVLDRHLPPVQRDAARAVVRGVTASLREWALVLGIAGAVVMIVFLVAQFMTRPPHRR